MASINPKKYYRKLNLRFHPDKINSADEQMLEGLGLTFDKIESFFGVVGHDKNQAFPFLYSKEELDRSTIKGLIAYAEKFENLDIEAQSAVLDRLVNKERFNRSENFLNEYANYETKCVKLHIEKGNGDWVDLVEDKSLLEGSGITRKEFEKIEGLVLEAVGRDEGRDAYKKFLDSVATLYQHCFKPGAVTDAPTATPTPTTESPTPAPMLPDTLIQNLNSLNEGDKLKVTNVKINGNAYDIEYIKSSSAPSTTIDVLSRIISVIKDTMPASAAELISQLQEIKIGGNEDNPTIDPTGVAILCSVAGPYSCDEITLPQVDRSTIIYRLTHLTDGQGLEVAKITIDSAEYVIKYLKASSDVDAIMHTASHEIVVQKFAMPSNDSDLKTDIENITISWSGGYPIVTSTGNGKAIKCPSVAPYNCDEVKFSIMDKLTSLKDFEELHIANVPINRKQYALKYIKARGSADVTLDVTSNTITVARPTMPLDLKLDIDSIKIGGSKANPQIDTNGKSIDCAIDFAALHVPGHCTAIKLPKDPANPGKEIPDAIMDALDSSKLNNANVDVLEEQIDDLKFKHGEWAVHRAVPFVALNPRDLSGDQVDNIVESHQKFEDKSVVHAADQIYQLTDCIIFGIC